MSGARQRLMSARLTSTMPNIRFISRLGIQEVVVPTAGNIRFRNGETKSVAEETAVTLLRNAEFVEADTGRNPNFCCADCGTETLNEAFVSPRLEAIYYRNDLGRRLCVTHFVERNPEWRQWHEILARRGGQEPVAPPEPKDVFFRLAVRSADLTPAFPATRAIYSIGDNAAEGDCVISYDDELHPYATFETGLDLHLPLERRFAPGKFVHDRDVATIESSDANWRAERVIAETQGQRFRADEEAMGKLIARIGELIAPSDIPDRDPAHLRWIVRGCKSHGAWSWRGGFIHVNEIATKPVTTACSVLIFGKACLSEYEADALWDTLCLLEGRTVQHVVTESYDSTGTLLQQRFRLGKPAPTESYSPFRHSGLDVTSEQISAIQEALTGMHEAGFNIEKVLDHMLFPTGGHMAHEALHLSIAAHTIAHEWLKYWKRRSSDGDRAAQSMRAQQRERGVVMKRRAFSKALPGLQTAIGEVISGLALHDRVKANILRGVDKSNDLTMGERLLQVLEADLQMALDADDRRTLGYRNELAHEGGFSVDFFDLDYDEKNLRLEDVGRLRNIVTEAVLRLCGYNGTVDDFTLPGGVRIIAGSPPSPFIAAR